MIHETESTVTSTTLLTKITAAINYYQSAGAIFSGDYIWTREVVLLAEKVL